MGDRLYNPIRGTFTSTDPVPGGNETAYTYPNDSVNKYDLNGHRWEVGTAAGGSLGPAIVVAAAVTALEIYYSVVVRGVRIPYPSIRSRRTSTERVKWYAIYAIYNEKNQLWKFGISGDRSMKRPKSQLSKCRQQRSFGWRAQRGHFVVVQTTVGWFNARMIEALRVTAYVRRWGHCPPGQYISCM